ncbi:MAG: sulfatase-like hydrolase/transferase [Bacteroidales bacterium]
MKHIIPIIGLSMLVPTALSGAEKPNIIFFLIDDNGWVDSQVSYGPEVYPNNLRFNTPNMVRLANSGVMMTNGYACGLSTPTRTSLMTGMNSAHTGITSFIKAYRDCPSDELGGLKAGLGPETVDMFDSLGHADWNYNGMSPEPGIEHTCYATPFPKILKDNGYYTIHVGKTHWSVNGTPGVNPYNMGFVVNVAGSVAYVPNSYLSEDNYGNKPEIWTDMAVQNMNQYYGSGLFLTEALTKEALKTLDYPVRHRQPFYMYLAQYATHSPIQADKRYYEKYLKAGMDKGQAKFASMVEGVDQSLGEILDYLEANNLTKNTIIILMADNGGDATLKSKGGIPHTQNKPLREGKASVYEGGVRVHCMFSWPGHISSGTRINTPVTIADMFPTILDFAGVKEYTAVQSIDGKSLVKLVTKGSKLAAKAKERGELRTQAEENAFVVPVAVSGIDPERQIISHYPNKWRTRRVNDVDYMSAIREGEWKLVYRMITRKLELYNLNEDLGELNDISAQRPEIVTRLAKDLSKQLRIWKAPMPLIPSTGAPVPMPDEVL